MEGSSRRRRNHHRAGTLSVLLVAALSIAVKKIFLVPPKWIVKSTAGKPARSATREKLLQEHLELSTEPINL